MLSAYRLLVLIRAVCRDESKSGACPKLSTNNPYATCEEECQNDSQCPGEKKCCYNGCGRSCLDVVQDPGSVYLPDEPDEGSYVARPVRTDPNAPKIQVIGYEIESCHDFITAQTKSTYERT